MIHKQGNRHSRIDKIHTNKTFNEQSKSGVILTAFSDHYSPVCLFSQLKIEETKSNIYKISFCDL